MRALVNNTTPGMANAAGVLWTECVCLRIRSDGLVNPDPSGLYNPETTADILLFKAGRQLSGKRGDRVDDRFAIRPEHHDPGGRLGREAQNVTKVEIKRDEASLLRSADVINRLIVRTRKFLIVNGRDVVTSLAQNPGYATPEIFVQLEFHADFSTGSGT